jgi:hypothetical protein
LPAVQIAHVDTAFAYSSDLDADVNGRDDSVRRWRPWINRIAAPEGTPNAAWIYPTDGISAKKIPNSALLRTSRYWHVVRAGCDFPAVWRLLFGKL